jgi:hypothetical protein
MSLLDVDTSGIKGFDRDSSIPRALHSYINYSLLAPLPKALSDTHSTTGSFADLFSQWNPEPAAQIKDQGSDE